MTEGRERSVLWKFAAGVLLMVLLTAGATATAGLLTLDNLASAIRNAPGGVVKTHAITRAEAGTPQTILLLGSDRRFKDRHDKHAARSDTLMLLRLDPDQQATTMLSIPRDLKVQIPGHGYEKINAAYSYGGADLALRTIKSLLGLKVNHVVDVNFSGFRKAVDAVGCVYIDVDRHYYHSNAGLPASAQYAEINLKPGYQRLCGKKALDYVRFRHADSDFVRAARQQDFLRSAKDQVSSSSLIGKRTRLVHIFVNATQADRDLGTLTGLERLLKLALFSAGHPVRQVAFPGRDALDTTSQGVQESYVTADPAAIRQTVRRFLHGAASTGTRRQRRRARGRRHVGLTLLVPSRRVGQDAAAPLVVRRRQPFPVLFPTRATPAGRPASDGSPRAYGLRDRAGRRRRAYRLVYVQNEILGQYYGIQGTDWRTPPLLAHPTGSRTVGGRHLLLFGEGGRLRTVAWRTPRAVYWVSNTLSLTLDDAQMVGIAASLRGFTGQRR